MRKSWIALVLCIPILRIEFIVRMIIFITLNFCQNACRHNTRKFWISFYTAFISRFLSVKASHSIDNYLSWNFCIAPEIKFIFFTPGRKFHSHHIKSNFHCLKISLKNIYLVNYFFTDNSDSPARFSLITSDAASRFFSESFLLSFKISTGKSIGKENTSGRNRTSQRTSSRFVRFQQENP